MSSTSKTKRRPGRPRMPPTRVVPLRLRVPLAEALDAYADQRGISRNQAGIDLLAQALSGQCPPSQPSSSGYNPMTGEFE